MYATSSHTPHLTKPAVHLVTKDKLIKNQSILLSKTHLFLLKISPAFSLLGRMFHTHFYYFSPLIKKSKVLFKKSYNEILIV